MLAIVGTAGFNSVLIMSAIVSGLIDGLHISAAVAGRIASCDVYGMSAGALVAVLIVRRVAWRPLAYGLLCALIGMDLATTLIHAVAPLMVLRAVHGLCAGLLIGVSYGVYARSGMPERCFAMLCAVQACLTGFGLMFLPRLVPLYGTPVLFIALAAFGAVALAMLPLLPAFAIPPQSTAPAVASRAQTAGIALPQVLALLSVFFFQAGNMAPAAYIIELGRASSLSLQFITTAIGVSGWLAMVGALLVVVFGMRWGRTVPIAIGTVAAILGNAAFHASAWPAVYAAANVATAVTWYFGVSYLFGLCASFDRTGRSAALAGLCSKLGYATGPYAASFLAGAGGAAAYASVINLGVGLLCISATLGIVASRRAPARAS